MPRHWTVALIALAACGGEVGAENASLPPADEAGPDAIVDAVSTETSAGGMAGAGGGHAGGNAGAGEGGSTAGSAGHGGTTGGNAGAGGATGGAAGSAGSPGCDPGKKPCGLDCVDVSDPHYGCTESSCTPCALAHASSVCASNACAVGLCETGYKDCDTVPASGCEADLSSDKNNCGGCGLVCTAPPNSCPYYGTCANGACLIPEGPPGTADCDCILANGNETNLTSDPENCGMCGVVCAGPNPTCIQGLCDDLPCAAPFADCDGNVANGCETNLTALANCGACGVECNLPHATESCGTGVCALVSCDQGWSSCDGILANGCETNIASDWHHCGGCSTPCDSLNGTPWCFSGTCMCSGSPGYGNCDGDCSNGLETNLSLNLENCGVCGMVCALANAGEACANGTCVIGTCAAGWANCDGFAGNGCETPLDLVSSCGACGIVCSVPHATPACALGACAIGVCEAGRGDCDNDPLNGCETQITTPSNCGACGAVCNALDADVSCATGACGCSSACPSNLHGNCDGNCANGCETSLATFTDCDACGRACAPPHASASCSTGACLVVACDSGWGDCNNLDTDGCETPLTTISNCGACGAKCNDPQGPESCLTGTCGCGCAPGMGNCDKSCSNGCEAPLNTLIHCGGCNQRCSLAHASESCSTASCLVISCDAGWQDCDSNPVNGCEVEVAFDQKNCGSCGTACPPGKVCHQNACK